VASYTIRSNVTLTAAWGATTAFITGVPINTWFRSPTLMRKRIGTYPDSMTRLTRVSFDPDDYASATMNGDSVMQYIVVSELDVAGNTLSTSPVLIVPPTNFFATGRATLVVQGTAAATAAGTNGFPPSNGPRALLPMFSDEVTFYNTDDTQDLFVSFGQGRQELTVPQGASRTFTEAGAWNLWLRGPAGGATDFEATFSVVNGLQS
jgi:hypothetical protein